MKMLLGPNWPQVTLWSHEKRNSVAADLDFAKSFSTKAQVQVTPKVRVILG